MTNSVAFRAGRRAWVEHIAGRLADGSARKVFEKTSLSPVEQAMLNIHVGVGHLYGIADADSEVEGWLDESQVRNLISNYWRDGRCDPYLARCIPFLWTSFYRLARDTGAIGTSLLTHLFASQLGRRMRAESDYQLEPEAISSLAESFIGSADIQPGAVDSELNFPLDCEGSHLGFVASIVGTSPPNVLELVTLLEYFACFPEDDEMTWEVEALIAAGKQHEIFRSMPGGWPGPQAEDVPAWVRDVVLGDGARMYYASTGHVPGWIIVAESADELRAIVQWTYEPRFGFGEDDGGTPGIAIPLTFPSDGNTAQAYWRYPLGDFRSVTWLRTLVAIGVVRLEVYRIDPDAHLEFVFAFGCPLPLPLRERVREFLHERSLPEHEVRVFHEMRPEHDLESMSLVEQNLFDRMHTSLSAMRTDKDSAVALAYRHYLETLDASTAAALAGLTHGIELYHEARENLLVVEAQSGRESLSVIDLRPLGVNRAYIQFRVIADEPTRLVAHAAYVDDSDILKTLTVEFRGRISMASDVEQQSEVLAAGLVEFKALLAAHIRSVVICPAPAAYNLPYHEAFIRLGFDGASYTHRVATLGERSRGAGQPTIVGYAGKGDRYIEAVNVELGVVAAIHGVEPASRIPQSPEGFLHLAGHGQSGPHSYEIAMEISPESPLSAARVLLDLDLSGCELVFLSACSSGRGEYQDRQLVESIPMDVAFIEAGARAVISTSHPVNDYIAAIFAIAFHAAWTSGTSIWGAYLSAREAARTGVLPVAPQQLEHTWPTWKSDVALAVSRRPNDWQLYRISGRYWP